MSIQVLVAEDDYFIALDVVEELDAAGFIPVGPFANISNALEYCREHTPDCAVLDVRLADGDSFLIADLLAKLHVPFLFHSAHACREALQSRYPGIRVCPKPAASETLANMVADLCHTEVAQPSA